MTQGERDWYESAFDREYLDLYAHRNESDAERALAFFDEHSLIKRDDVILDLCCGNGRHSLALCRRGHRVHGFDLSEDLLREFQSRSDCPISIVRGDMRHLAYRDMVFDAVVNLFTSFGYFATDEENWAVFAEVARVLRPRGRFVFDYLNAPQVVATLQERTERDLDRGFRVVERRRHEDGRIMKEVELFRDGRPVRNWRESVRLFTKSDVEAALLRTGFSIEGVFGDFDSSPHSEASPRLIFVAIRR